MSQTEGFGAYTDFGKLRTAIVGSAEGSAVGEPVGSPSCLIAVTDVRGALLFDAAPGSSLVIFGCCLADVVIGGAARIVYLVGAALGGWLSIGARIGCLVGAALGPRLG